MNPIDLFEESDGQLHLHRQGDTTIYDLETQWRPGGFEADARQLARDEALHTYESHDREAASAAEWRHIATWYGPGVFMVYPSASTIGRAAERYIGSYLIHAPEAHRGG
jgi:hypothetical protein